MGKPILIAHRGNLNGVNKKMENNPAYLQIALDMGFDVETDVWLIGDKWYLGHDEPQYLLQNELELFMNPHVWCHCKNFAAFYSLRSLAPSSGQSSVHCFWHQNDDYTLTSRGIIWAFPGKELKPIHFEGLFPSNVVAVMPEWHAGQFTAEQFRECYGICTDEVLQYKQLLGI